MEDVKQIWLIREQKVSLSLLIAKGQVGEELLERFIGAEKELEAEIVEVVGEANSFMEGYGGMIFGLASDMVAHEKWTEIYYKIEENRTIERTSLFPLTRRSINSHMTTRHRNEYRIRTLWNGLRLSILPHPLLPHALALQPSPRRARLYSHHGRNLRSVARDDRARIHSRHSRFERISSPCSAPGGASFACCRAGSHSRAGGAGGG